jgi:hypothetical protein
VSLLLAEALRVRGSLEVTEEVFFGLIEYNVSVRWTDSCALKGALYKLSCKGTLPGHPEDKREVTLVN